jgi:hypothetical protein
MPPTRHKSRAEDTRSAEAQPEQEAKVGEKREGEHVETEAPEKRQKTQPVYKSGASYPLPTSIVLLIDCCI